jgi:hypothetical protein
LDERGHRRDDRVEDAVVLHRGRHRGGWGHANLHELIAGVVPILPELATHGVMQAAAT